LSCRQVWRPSAAGALLLIAFDAIEPGLGAEPAIRALVGRINFPATLLNGCQAFLLFAGESLFNDGFGVVLFS
jgi:hypothetical protein